MGSGCFDFLLSPMQQQGGIDDDQDGAGVMNQGADNGIQYARHGQHNSDSVQCQGKGKIAANGDHHPLCLWV